MTDLERLKMIEETVREIEQSYYRIWVRACLRSGEESIRAMTLKSEWTSMLSARMLFDNDAHLLRMHDIYCTKEDENHV